jgi:hypothetical protein
MSCFKTRLSSFKKTRRHLCQRVQPKPHQGADPGRRAYQVFYNLANEVLFHLFARGPPARENRLVSRLVARLIGSPSERVSCCVHDTSLNC